MWCNTQLTFSPSPDNARSESELETDPRNPLNVVSASKRFIHPSTCDFTLAAYAGFDGGESRTEARQWQPEAHRRKLTSRTSRLRSAPKREASAE